MITPAEYLATDPPISHRTLCFLLRGDEILLGRRKRGKGEGKYAGIGGKVEANETVEQAAIRETEEEVGLIPQLSAKVATVTFLFPYDEDWNQHVHVYLSRTWTGALAESDEIAPAWHQRDELPYDRMFTDAIYWLPAVLRGEVLTGRFIYDRAGKIYQREITLGAIDPTLSP